MPEATLLYSVTAVVIAGLVIWVAVVLKTAKEPWIRASAGNADAPAGGAPVARVDEAKRRSADDADVGSTVREGERR